MKTLKYALKNEWYILILLLVPFLIIPFIWDQLPAQMATHWNLQGEVNGTSNKAVGALLQPVLNVFLYFLLLYAPQIDPKKFIVLDQKAMPVIRLSLAVFIFCSYVWSMLKALHYPVPSVNWILPAVALLLVILGNYLRTIQPNYFIGIRVPWTLEDPQNWRQTHNIASWLWVAGGLILLLLFPFLNAQLYFNFFMAIVIGIVLIPCGYSFYLYKTQSDMMKTLSTLSILLLFCIAAHAQQPATLEGHWKGHIDVQGQQLIIKTNFTGEDSLRGTIDIPQQGATGLPLQKISQSADSVFFEFQAGPGLAQFKGAFRGDSAIAGTFHQRGLQFPFELKRDEPTTDTAQKAASVPKPYHHEDIIIKNDSVAIGGTLTWPKDKKAGQLVIMISGSGAQNRDEELLGFKPFAQIADYLTRHDIATFRFDDRGIGESGGDPNVGLDVLAEDVQAIYTSLHDHPQLSQASIGLLGHSQGGYIANKLAAGNTHFDFIILMSGPSFPLDKIIFQQTEAIEKASGAPDSVIQKGLQSQRELFAAMREGTLDSLRKVRIKETEAQLAKLPDKKKQHIENVHNYASQKVNQEIAQLNLPIFQSMIAYDPIQDTQNIQIPVLALFGEKDLQVLPEPNARRLRKALEESESDYTIKIFENANHLYQKAKKGLPSEYGTLDKKFVADFLPTIAQWVKKQ